MISKSRERGARTARIVGWGTVLETPNIYSSNCSYEVSGIAALEKRNARPKKNRSLFLELRHSFIGEPDEVAQYERELADHLEQDKHEEVPDKAIEGLAAKKSSKKNLWFAHAAIA